MMRELNREEIKKIQVGILKEVASFCEDHHIKYSLAYGTLLGAVRHGGFIPWDDDIDIMMPRNDYERFVTEYRSDIFKVYNCKLSPKYDYVATKISDERTVCVENIRATHEIGINVDLFPIDNLPFSYKEFCRMCRKINLYQNIYLVKTVRFSNKRRWYKNITLVLFSTLFTLVPNRYVLKSIDRLSSLNEKEITGKAGCLISIYNIREFFGEEVFQSYIKLPFENCLFYVIKDYHQYLTRIYGSYMTMPPREKRVSTHEFSGYLK